MQDDDTDVFEKGKYECYQSIPAELEHLCYAERGYVSVSREPEFLYETAILELKSGSLLRTWQYKSRIQTAVPILKESTVGMFKFSVTLLKY